MYIQAPNVLWEINISVLLNLTKFAWISLKEYSVSCWCGFPLFDYWDTRNVNIVMSKVSREQPWSIISTTGKCHFLEC